jgi:hypothetical protein
MAVKSKLRAAVQVGYILISNSFSNKLLLLYHFVQLSAACFEL